LPLLPLSGRTRPLLGKLSTHDSINGELQHANMFAHNERGIAYQDRSQCAETVADYSMEPHQQQRLPMYQSNAQPWPSAKILCQTPSALLIVGCIAEAAAVRP
jgi:hypothetical protein